MHASPVIHSTPALPSQRGRPARWCVLALFALLAWLTCLLPAPAQAAPQLTEQQRAWVLAHPTVRVGLSVDFPPYYFAAGRGRYEGFVIELMDRVVARTGLKLQYTNFERFGDVLTAMRDGQIDVTPFTSEAPGRNEFLRFVRPLFSTQMVIVTDRRISDVSGDSGFGTYRVAVERGSTAADLLRDRFPQARVVEYDHGEKALLGVATGDADVFIGFRQVAAYYMEKHLTANLVMRGALPSPGTALGPAVRKDMPELAGILDAAIQDLSIEEITEIASRWLPRSVFVPQGGPKATLTPAQRQWVQTNGTLRLGYDEDFSPIAFKTAGGGFDGLAADLTRAVAGRVGLVIASETGASFANVVQGARQNDIDVVVAAGRNAQRTLEFDFVGPFLRVPTVVVGASSQRSDITLDTPGPVRLALLKDHFLMPMLRSRYPSLKLLEFGTQAAVLQAVRNGQADLAIGNMKVVNQLLESLHMGALRTVGVVPQGDSELYFAVRNSKPELAQVLRVGLDAITPAERAAIEERWLRVSWTEGIAWPRFLLLAAALLAVSGLVVFSFWRSNQRLRSARQTLRDAHQAAEALAASRAHFTAYLTHELRGSLGGLAGGMALLSAGSMPVERRGALVQAMHRSADTLLDLCERTLDFERMLAGGVELQLAPMSVHETVQRAVAPWSVQAELKGLALRVDDHVTAGTCVRSDAVRLTQVLQNLLGNAVKFTARGEVVLRVELAAPEASTTGSPPVCRLQVSVSDSGSGVPDAERGVLFQPFTQGSEGRRARRGAGLGLSISAKIVEALGGGIELVASSEAGSTFAFWVPVQLLAEAT